jgi:hypothetical protein
VERRRLDERHVTGPRSVSGYVCDRTRTLSVSSVVVSAPPRSIFRLLALGQGSVELDEESDEDVSAMVPRPGVGGANQRVQRNPSRLVRAGKLKRECSVQLPVSCLPELSVERMRCRPWHCDPSARQTALNLDNVALCQAVEHHGEVNHRSRSRPLLGIPGIGTQPLD